MTIDYTLLAGLLLYFLMIKLVASSSIKPLTASLVVVLGNFAISSFVRGVVLHAYDAPLSQLFGIVPIATVVMQLAIALVTFTKLDRSDDSYGAWLVWGVTGCIGIFFIAPFIATMLFASF